MRKIKKMKNINVRDYNRQAWDRQVAAGNRWTQPVSADVIAAARRGEWQVLLTEVRPVPKDWFPPLASCDLLALACGGGQQGPIFAALGANVTVFDNSPAQLARDREVALREGLTNLRTVEGDMADLSAFPDESFDLVFNPVSTVFVPDVRPVWREVWRVLRPGGLFLAGLMNPVFYLFDIDEAERSGKLEVRFSIPYSDLESRPQAERDALLAQNVPLEFGHSLTDLIAGQLEAGFVLTDFYEDEMPDAPLHGYHPVYFATRARKCPKQC